ncbi:hypothetical protein ANN_01335 [Periplaneta americana]|uniref:DUF659 domain-containing protein n=1 Tax=Periplaneta americana TaxID=6978 RepID=A0ABQ8TVQ3_PERAM|nr:hypothetical protein ANN_01335 [Periplaneta americana]
MEHTNHATMASFVNDGLKVLWSEGVLEDKVLVLYSDAAAYMLKAGTALRVFYQNMIHFTCLSHGLQRVAEEVRSNYPQVNSIIPNTKKVFVKASQRVLYYREQLPNMKLPSAPVLTRPTDTRKEMDNESDDGQFSENEILSVLCSAFKTGETSVNINEGVLSDNSNAKENRPSENGLLQVRHWPSSVTEKDKEKNLQAFHGNLTEKRKKFKTTKG